MDRAKAQGVCCVNRGKSLECLKAVAVGISLFIVQAGAHVLFWVVCKDFPREAFFLCFLFSVLPGRHVLF